ncbi:MAG: rhomboid family intramembrane serine protease [Planctomycetota bacterium]|jgi:membrane associated rhomboid family serine protease|nr:rhomboid family intramembrane serine protease [Planctomycetota bacterium]MDP6990428.1 rhomboid family intramembrane serine protease [Planctomycetota bacterium]
MSDPQDTAETEVLRTRGARAAREAALVLNSVGIPHRLRRDPGASSLLVAATDAERAAAELERYRRENSAWPPARSAFESAPGWVPGGGLFVLVLGAFHRLAVGSSFGVDWYAAGRLDAAAVRAGEWWRAATALTLHGSLAHLASNLVFGAVFGCLLAQALGPGPAWLCVLLSGLAGNLLNALVQGEHLAVGASTAVFGALGALAAIQSTRRTLGGAGPLGRWAPLVVGAVLLGWNGMGSARLEPLGGVVRDPTDTTDVGAHIAGFVCGIVLGKALALWHARPGGISSAARRAMAAALAALLAGAWLLAVRRGA